jgi:hypothetical protein
MIDVRYHIYSLAAVFFALALGIVIGTSFAKRGPANESERRTISKYENSMRVFKRELEMSADSSAQKEIRIKNSEEFCRVILPIVAKDKLAWKHIAIVQTGDYDDLSGSAKRALELAGAKVTNITDISRDFPFDDDQKVAETLRTCDITPPSDTKAARDKLFSILSDAICGGKSAFLFPKLEKCGVIKFTGDRESFTKAKMIALVGGADSEEANTAESVDCRLLSQLENLGITVVGCEGTDAVSSYIPAWHKMGIPTVDNADSAIGQIAVICALNGDKAKFGVKETADRLIPQSLETR